MHGLRIDGRLIDVRLEKWNGTRVYLRPLPQNVVWTLSVCGITSSAPYSMPDISLGRCQHNLGTMASRHWVHLSVRLFGPTVYSVQISHGTTFLAKRWSTAGARAVLVRFAGSVENAFILRQLNKLDIVCWTDILTVILYLRCQRC